MYRVGVVGFGMAGATAAYLLARDGHRVTLLERAPRNLGPVGAGDIAPVLGAGRCCGGSACSIGYWRMPPRSKELYARHARGGRTLVNNRFPISPPKLRAYGVHRGVHLHASCPNWCVAADGRAAGVRDRGPRGQGRRRDACSMRAAGGTGRSIS